MALPNAGWRIDWGDAPAGTVDAESLAIAEALAGATMRSLTGYQVGGPLTTVLPRRSLCSSKSSGFNPTLRKQGWVNTSCTCAPASAFLPPPVGRVEEVKVEGVTLAPANYRVERGSLLVRTDSLTWPTCPSDDFSVTYLNAFPVDDLGARAGGILAHEFYKGLTDPDTCRLPANVVGITRQGITMQIVTGLFPGGRTGIPEVDAYLAIWNPHGLRSAPAVYSPDLEVRGTSLGS